MTVALRPPNSEGWPGSSQPLSNSSRCQRRAHCGMCETDRGRSSVSLAGGRFSSRNAENSARNASTSESKVSCTVLLGDSRTMLCRAAQQELACFGPLECKLQVVLPGESHCAVQLQAVPEYQRLAFSCRRFGHRGRKPAPGIVGGNRQRGEVGQGPSA